MKNGLFYVNLILVICLLQILSFLAISIPIKKCQQNPLNSLNYVCAWDIGLIILDKNNSAFAGKKRIRILNRVGIRDFTQVQYPPVCKPSAASATVSAHEPQDD
ncbi:MAG: hypothetical protein ABI760_22850 [Ferruginibacter sp.]